MNIHPPYNITHLYLHKQLRFPSLVTHQQGNYLVFWWHEFALGHMFIAPNNNLSEDASHKELITAIAPAVEFYAQDQNAYTDNWQKWIAANQFENWAVWMDSIFSQITSDSIPAKVPVSVIICTRNRATQLQQCLNMLMRLPCRPEEIIVVDNAPTDDKTHKVVKQFEDVIYVRELRVGLDIARNTGVRQASRAVVSFVDDDVLVHPLWAYRVWETFKNPATAAMTGLVIAADLSTEAQFIFEKHWSFNRGYTDIYYGSDFINQTLSNGPPVWNIGAGANMAFRRDIFEEVGYFDELLDVGAAGCSGDSEMWYRILLHGHIIHYNPRAISFHEHRKEIKGLKRQIFYYMRGHAAAALIQQQQHQNAGYRKHLFWRLPKQYAQLLKSGFPRYSYRYRTLLAEILGVISGSIYYFRNRYLRSKIFSNQ